jgi:hypothetical protein
LASGFNTGSMLGAVIKQQAKNYSRS